MANPQLRETQEQIRVPFVNVAYQPEMEGDTYGRSNKRRVNCFPVQYKHPTTGEAEIHLQTRPGFSQINIDLAGLGDESKFVFLDHLGMRKMANTGVFAVHDGTNLYIVAYDTVALTTTLIGTIATAYLGEVYLTEIELTSARVPGVAIVWIPEPAAAADSRAFYVQATGFNGSFTADANEPAEITDAGFPVKRAVKEQLRGPIQQMNGIFYIMSENGNIFNSVDENDITDWGGAASATFVNVKMYPAKGIGVFRYKHHILAFTDSTMEFFNDDNDDAVGGRTTLLGSPLTRTDQAFIKIGAWNANVVRNIDDVIYFISSSDTNTVGLWRLDGYTPVKVSTPTEDVSLAIKMKTSSYQFLPRLSSLYMSGMKHILISGAYHESIFVPDYYPQIAADDVHGKAMYEWNNIGLESGFPQPIAMCYTIDTNSWWEFGAPLCFKASLQYAAAVLPATIYTSGEGNYTQICFFNATYEQSLTGGPNKYPWQLDVTNYAFGESVDSTIYTETITDADLGAILINDWPILVYATGHPHDFGTDRRKFINRAILNTQQMSSVYNTVSVAGVATSVPTYVWLFYGKTPVNHLVNANDGTQFRYFKIPAKGTEITGLQGGSARQTFFRKPYYNRLGATRELYWGVLMLAAQGAVFKDLELNISMGTE